MKKKNLLLGILMITGVCSIGLGVILYQASSFEKTENEKEQRYSFGETKESDLCISPDNCPIIQNEYSTLDFKTDIKKVDDIVKKINKETEDYYQKSIKSDMSDPSCSSKKDIFKHSFSVHSDFYIFENDNFISIAVERILLNLCTDTSEQTQLETYFYDKKSKKILTQEEIKQKFDIYEERITTTIKNNIAKLNEDSDSKLSYEETYKDGKQDYILFFDRDGNLCISYLQNTENVYYKVIMMDKDFIK